ncbi:uncharacterized protein LOC116107923 isoform X2 [Pistacia vera]|uniref:uncharacterized protein LOC116107923 isoform X2 n=1 Tax=Pistacia vera TaxID=55513 RepID=UPI00126352B0|nr:uncharacterized protein LOC116107923 isoform X2 [Pistacia vera]
MKTYFLSQDLWDIVNYENYLEISGSTLSEQQQEQLKESKKNDAAALFILQQAVDDNIFRKISRAQKANEAWDALREEFQGNPQTTALAEGREPEDFKKYLPLYKAILEGDLKSVQQLCDGDKNAFEARITVNLDTALHVAVGTGKANHIVEYLLNQMSMGQVSMKNEEGNTVLSVAAIVGNVRAARMIKKKDKNQTLIQDSNKSKRIPLIEATRHGQKKMINYLLEFSKKDLAYDSATRFTSRVHFVKLLIIAEFYDLALDLIKEHPSLATMTFYGGESLLSEITKKPSAFLSGGTKKLPFWGLVGVSKVTSYTKKIRETKLMRDYKVLELVKHLCKGQKWGSVKLWKRL